MNTPFWDTIRQLAEDKARFFMPGHKGSPAALPPFGAVLPYDITEIPGADDLSCPSDTLAQSQQNMARLYASGATLYSAAGSTSCIQAMLTLFLRPGEKIVMLRGCHLAAVRALGLIGADPVWILPKNGRAAPEDAAAALRQSGAKAVYVTSPTYEGLISDIPALRQVCDRFGAKLLVDNAHGAHLKFLSPDIHPISLGADATADSAHKTLPCLTPAALLHLRDASLAQKARRALNIYSSTSPSYLVLASLDIAAGLLQEDPPAFMQAAALLAEAAAAAPHLAAPADDPLKLYLLPARGGCTAQQVTAALAKEGVIPEIADTARLVLMASPYNPPEDFARLARALRAFPPKPPLPLPAGAYSFPTGLPLPEAVCSIREAMFAVSIRLPVAELAGRIAAEAASPCPPGVPLVLPGERITREMLPLLRGGGIPALDVIK